MLTITLATFSAFYLAICINKMMEPIRKLVNGAKWKFMLASYCASYLLGTVVGDIIVQYLNR